MKTAAPRSDRTESRITHYVYDQPGHLIRRANQMAWAVFREETAPLDVTPVQFSLLVCVDEFPAIDATRLSELICIDRATIGNIVERLEAKGLLSRQADPKDKRIKCLFVTTPGQQLVGEVCAMRARIGERVLQPLTPDERTVFMAMLAKLVGIEHVKERLGDLQSEI